MNIAVRIDGRPVGGNEIVGWGPRKVEIEVLGASPLAIPTLIRIGSTGPGGGLVFSPQPGAAPVAILTLPLAHRPGPLRAVFYVSGRFGAPSTAPNDARMTIETTGPSLPHLPIGLPGIPRGSSQASANVPMTVRVRKNANAMTAAERDRFLVAYAKLNNKTGGLYKNLREMHVANASSNIHGGPQFLPWHRAYVMNVEREIQAIDPLVALPYWRFDQPAPNLFTPEFMGATTSSASVAIAPTNPLSAWQTGGGVLDRRLSTWGVSILGEAQTLALGSVYAAFDGMEGDPHGSAHVSFTGPISGIATAPQDPLFFLLHCNVDRLWAKWQWLRNRFDPASVDSYPNQGASPGTGPVAIRTNDTMWPWDGVAGVGSRPPTAPIVNMVASAVAAAPGPKPTIGSMVDYQGKQKAANALGFDYDDVPYGS